MSLWFRQQSEYASSITRSSNMEQPSTKRRKLSPPGSTQTTLLTENAKPASQGGKLSSGHRASFMSPTKASLARFNPDLLPRTQSSEPKRRTRRNSPGIRARTSIAKETKNIRNGGTGARSGDESPGIDGVKTGPEVRDGEPIPRSGMSAAPQRRSRTPNAQHTTSKLSQTQPAYGTRAATLRTTQTASQPGTNTLESGEETVPQGVEQRNGVTIDESSMEKLPPTPTRRGIPQGAARVESSEPSLPSTPSQLGLEPPRERPKGLLFGTPSKKTKRQKEERRPSPPRSKEAPSVQSSAERPTTLVLGPKVFLASLPKPAPTPEQAELQGKITLRAEIEQDVLRSGSKVLEGALVSSWQEPAAKESVGQQKLQKKLVEMAGKLIRLREDIEQLRTLAGGTADTPSEDHAVHLDGQNLRFTSASESMNLCQKLANFFPFFDSGKAPSLRTASDPATVDPEKSVKILDSNLQTGVTDPEVLLQMHDVELISRGTMVEKLQIVFDSRSLEVSELSLLGPSLLYRPVLEAWTHASAPSKRLFSIGRAINRYTYVVGCRIACWQACQERYLGLVEPLRDKDAIQSQQAITFRRKRLSLSVNWTINLKDDGNAESNLSIHTELPATWLEERIASGREAEQVQEAFDLLVRERGVTEAIGAIVKLLFQDD